MFLALNLRFKGFNNCRIGDRNRNKTRSVYVGLTYRENQLNILNGTIVSYILKYL